MTKLRLNRARKSQRPTSSATGFSGRTSQFKSTEARLPAAKAKYERYKGLFAKGSISKESYDEAEASYYALSADIESLKATIARREIKAPFAGVIGIRNVFLGQYLQPGTDIVRLEDTSVMRLRFTVPQRDISRISLIKKSIFLWMLIHRLHLKAPSRQLNLL